MRAFVDQEKCIGCTLCSQFCPEVFKMETDKVVVFKNPVPEDVEDACRQAEEQCPVEAISINE